jgi:hypothetical protein
MVSLGLTCDQVKINFPVGSKAANSKTTNISIDTRGWTKVIFSISYLQVTEEEIQFQSNYYEKFVMHKTEIII